MEIKLPFKTYLTVAAVVLTIGIFLTGGYYLGYDKGYESGAALSDQILAQNISGEGGDEAPVDFSVFWEAWRKLKQLHVDGEKVSNQDLLYGALKGLAGSFGDPNTNFFPPADAEKFQEDVSGSFGGIGADIGSKDEVIVIISPLKESPAERAGLKPGDMILKIDDKPTTNLDVNDAVKVIRGEIGTVVKLNVIREGWLQPRDISVTRERITIPTLDLTMRDDNKIGDIKLYYFNENATVEFYKAIYGLAFGDTHGIILDLRNNPGGYLEVANDLAGWFFDRGTTVVSERFRSESDRTFRASGNAALRDIPVVVLVNGGSASAAEILAGALRDNRGVKLVGEKTFGKGTVQELEELNDGSNLKVTVAHWVLPNGQILDKDGLKPDYEVAVTDEDIKAGRDPQMDKALEVLRGEIQEKILAGKPFGIRSITGQVSIGIEGGGVQGPQIQILPAN